MALQEKICVKGTGNCNVIDVFDITGTYGISNPVLPNSASPTGYGLPNLDISTIVSAVLDIQKYDFESDTVKPFVTGIDVSSVLPNITGTPFRINGATYGVTFVDGIYHFDLTYGITALAITNVTYVGTLVTVTTATPLSVVVGQPVTISGVTGTNAAFSVVNGTFGVTSVSGSTFQYSVGTTPVGTYDAATGTATTNYTAEFYFLQDCEANCCYAKLIADKCACSGGDTKAAELYTLLESLEASWCCTNFQAVSDILKKINKICSPCGCH